MTKDERINSYIEGQLKTEKEKEKYFDILTLRIDENRKTLNRLFFFLILTAISFPLIVEAKISEISVGPFKLIDNKIALASIPTVFTYTYYKYLLIWFDLVEQKHTYRILSSNFFKIEKDSFLLNRINPFSLIDSISRQNKQVKIDLIGCLSYLLWIPTSFILIFIPFGTEFYLIKETYNSINPISFFDWLIIIIPIIIACLTIVSLIQVIKSDLRASEKHKK